MVYEFEEIGTGEKQLPDLWPGSEREIPRLDPGGVTVGSQGHFAPGRNPAPTTTDLPPARQEMDVRPFIRGRQSRPRL